MVALGTRLAASRVLDELRKQVPQRPGKSKTNETRSRKGSGPGTGMGIEACKVWGLKLPKEDDWSTAEQRGLQWLRVRVRVGFLQLVWLE